MIQHVIGVSRRQRVSLMMAALVGSVSGMAISVPTLAATPPDAQTASAPTVRVAPALLAVSSPTGTTPAAPATNQPDTGDIVVTARRQAESQERVPIAITAFGQGQLAARSITTAQDLQAGVPGLLVRQTTSQNTPVYSIRGQSVDSYSGSKPAVLPYIDDVQLNTTSASSFFDLESIQVLKGPQGTLFGRNTTGGAVLYTTAVPKSDFGGYLTAKYGNYNYIDLQGAVDIPLAGDTAALRIAGDITNRNGYVHNLFDNSELGSDRRQALRATLVLKPFSGFKNTTVAEYDHSTGTNVPLEVYSIYACGATNHGIPLNSGPSCLYSPALDAVLDFPGAFQAFLAAHPGVNPNGVYASLADQKRWGPWTTSVNNSQNHRGWNYYVIDTVEYSLSHDLTIKNIISVSRSKSHDQFDPDGTPFPVVVSDYSGNPNPGYSYDNRAFSEELQIQGKANNLSYIAGFYYAQERDLYDAEFGVFDLSPIAPATALRFNTDILDNSEAAYAQGTYDLSDLTSLQGLSFTGGVRYTWEQVDLKTLPNSLFYPAAPQRLSFSDPSWQVGLQYQATNHLLLYVVQRGSWRSGGFNGEAPPISGNAAAGGNEFKPETTYDVEAGAKFQGRVNNVPVRLNLDVYNQWIRNVQRTVYPTLPTGPAILTTNIPSAQVTGFEGDIDVSPTDWLNIGGNLAYTHARFTSADALIFGQSFDFGPYGDAAKFAGAAYVQIGLPVPPEIGKMSIRADVYAQTSQYFSNLDNTIAPDTKLPGYSIVNLRYEWQDLLHTHLTAAAFSRNVLNKGYYVGGFPGGSNLGANAAIPAEPRTFGVELTLKF